MNDREGMVKRALLPALRGCVNCANITSVRMRCTCLNVPFTMTFEFHRLFSSFVAKKFDNNQSALDLDITVWNLELSDNDMKSLMNGDGSNCFWNDLANFLLACKRKRCQHLNT